MSAFAVPYPPSVNTYWRHSRGVTHISLEGRAYRHAVVSSPALRGVRFGSARLSVTLAVSPPDRRRRDLDNLPKGLLDALMHAGVYEDDSQIDELIVRRGKPVKGGSVAVSIEVIG